VDGEGFEPPVQFPAQQFSRLPTKPVKPEEYGTDRGRNGRKTRKTYCFSKDWDIHGAVTYFTMYTYNFY